MSITTECLHDQAARHATVGQIEFLQGFWILSDVLKQKISSSDRHNIRIGDPETLELAKVYESLNYFVRLEHPPEPRQMKVLKTWFLDNFSQKTTIVQNRIVNMQSFYDFLTRNLLQYLVELQICQVKSN